MIAADITVVGSLVGALAPVLTALLFIPIRTLARRMEGNHVSQVRRADGLEQRLREAEAAIRGDLANGIKAKLDTIEQKVDSEATRTEATEAGKAP